MPLMWWVVLNPLIFLKSVGNVKQCGGLRALLNIAKRAAPTFAVPFNGESEFGVEPDVAGVAFGRLAFVLDRAPAIHGGRAHFTARTAGTKHQLKPEIAGIFDIGCAEKGVATLQADAGGALHLGFLVGDDDTGHSGGHVEDGRSGASGRHVLDADFIAADVDFIGADAAAP